MIYHNDIYHNDIYHNDVCIKLPQVFGLSRYISAIYRACLQVKNSFVNISEVNRQCLHMLGTRSEDDFEKVSSTSIYISVEDIFSY